MTLSHHRFFHLPHVEDGMRIGLYGGSFNPPHQGHVLVVQKALKAFQLDQIWWLVTPGNPLKDARHLAPLDCRLAASRALIRDPRIRVSAYEATIKTRYSADTIAHIIRQKPHLRFVWLMGADSFADFHRWQHWRDIAAMLPLGIIDRPGATFAALASPAARSLAAFRLNECQAPRLAFASSPRWCLIHGRRSPLSSTRLRHNL